MTSNRKSSQPSLRQRRIAERYRQGDPIASIAADEGVDHKTVRNVARRAGLAYRLPRQQARNTRILERYRVGDPVIEIAREEKVSSQYVSTLAMKAGQPPRAPLRRYEINERAFDQPDAVGWWLIGLLAADGSVSARDNLIALSQREADADVLYEFLRYVGCPDRPLIEARWRSAPANWQERRGRQLEARIYSRHIGDRLAAYGIVPRKTRSLRFSELAAARPGVWLGLLDGDGSLGANRNHGRPRIDFFGTRAVMEQCAAFWGQRLTLNTGRNPSLIRHVRHLWRVALYGVNAGRAATILLESSPVSMRRKRRTLEAIAALGASDLT